MLKRENLLKEAIIRGIKIIDIGYIVVLYFVFAYLISLFMDIYLGVFDKNEYDSKSTLRIILELLLQLWIYGVLAYIIRNVVEHIPFPLDGIMNFDHRKVKEVSCNGVFLTVLMWNQKHFTLKAEYLYNNRILPFFKK